MRLKRGIASCKGIQDSLGFLGSTLWIPESRYWIPDSLSVELRFRILVVCGIPDLLSWIPDSKAQDFRFHKQKFLGLRITSLGSSSSASSVSTALDCRAGGGRFDSWDLTNSQGLTIT